MTEKKHIEKCLYKIEKIYNHGPSCDWTRYHFENLSDDILKKTGISISVSSLRRLFGKNKTSEKYNPQAETKNALAKYIGYPSWSAYVEATEGLIQNKRSYSVYLIPLIVLMAAAVLTFVIYKNVTPAYQTGDLHFELLNLQSENIPHTVVLKYSIPPEADDIYVNFKTDNEDILNNHNKVKLDPGSNIFTYTYDRKDYYKISIFNNEKILKRFDVYLTTKGWEAFLEQGSNYYQIKQLFPSFKSRLYVPPGTLEEYGIDTTKDFRVYYRYFNALQQQGDHFSFNSVVKASPNHDHVKCHHLQYDLKFENGNIFVTLNQEGCSQNSNIQLNGKGIQGFNNDLTKLTLDYNQKNRIEIANQKQKLNIYINDLLSYSMPHDEKLGTLKGIRIEFLGSMSVDTLYFKN